MNTHDDRIGWDADGITRESEYAAIAETERVTRDAMIALYEWAYFRDQGNTHTFKGEPLPTVTQLVAASDELHAVDRAMFYERQNAASRWYS